MIEHLRAMIILDVNRRRSVCSLFEYQGGSAANFFFCLLLLHLCLVSLESPCFDRGRSKAGGEQCAACQCVSTQQAYTRMGYVEDIYTYGICGGHIHVWDMWRTYIGYAYVVYVWTGRIRMEYRSQIYIFNFCDSKCVRFSPNIVALCCSKVGAGKFFVSASATILLVLHCTS